VLSEGAADEEVTTGSCVCDLVAGVAAEDVAGGAAKEVEGGATEEVTGGATEEVAEGAAEEDASAAGYTVANHTHLCLAAYLNNSLQPN
jgi:hypothetical protein